MLSSRAHGLALIFLTVINVGAIIFSLSRCCEKASSVRMEKEMIIATACQDSKWYQFLAENNNEKIKALFANDSNSIDVVNKNVMNKCKKYQDES